MAEKAAAVVIAGVACPDEPARNPAAAALWAAIEDAGIVPSPDRPVTVPTPERLSELAGVPGVRVEPLQGEELWTAVRKALAGSEEAVVAVHEPGADVAVVLTHTGDPERYGVLGDDPVARLSALRPLPVPPSPNRPG